MSLCAVCGNHAVTTIPVVGPDRVCAQHAQEFWRAVVRVGSALAELNRHVGHGIAFPVTPPPRVYRFTRTCRQCPTVFQTDGEHTLLCRACFTVSRRQNGRHSWDCRTKPIRRPKAPLELVRV